VPTRNGITTGFTVRVCVTGLNTGGVEGGSVTNVRPLSDGSPNPIFVVPRIRTAPNACP
jgi:hypothetical protein